VEFETIEAGNPPGALPALVARWWAGFAARVEQAAAEWNARSALPARVTFTRQSEREVSIAHRSASTELRVEGTRVRVTSRRAEPTRNNIAAATLVEFRHGADGPIALVNGQPSTVDHVVEHVVGPILRSAIAT
jgi:hypothetical protein